MATIPSTRNREGAGADRAAIILWRRLALYLLLLSAIIPFNLHLLFRHGSVSEHDGVRYLLRLAPTMSAAKPN